jgi:TetR/AcrR family transcriptional repressor of nem operon
MPDKKQLLLQKGAEIIHLKGFHHTGINEILEAAKVPKGSFYFYFKSKEDFGLQLIDYYSTHFIAKSKEYLARTDLPYLFRMKAFFDDFLQFFSSHECSLGCPIGNLAQEMGDLSESFRQRLGEVMVSMMQGISAFLKGAVEQGEVPASLDIDSLSDFVINSWEGSLVRMKVTKDTSPLVLFDKILFDSILSFGQRD